VQSQQQSRQQLQQHHEPHPRYELTPSSEQPLPIYIESIGYNPRQEKIIREDGYPHFHWLQTISGDGLVSFDGKNISSAPNSGMMLLPGVPHRYEQAGSETWQTMYITFNGPVITEFLTSLGLFQSGYYEWENDTPVSTLLGEMLDRVGSENDVFGIHASVDMYRFLITLRKYGQLHKKAAISRNLEKLRPLTVWLEEQIANPNIGLEDMASVLSVSVRQLNSLFGQTFGQPPYTYFLHLRIRKAKEMLLNRPDLSIKQIALHVGFRDTSHFIATFRKSVGLPPRQFRRLN
jgi:AraC-like DNA-binding protein